MSATFLTATIGHRTRHDRAAEDANGAEYGGEAPPQRDPKEAVIEVWKLLASIAGIMAILLGAHYAFVMASVKGLIQDHELRDAKERAGQYVSAQDYERRHAELARHVEQMDARDAQMRADFERIEKDLTLIRDRQHRVLVKLHLDGEGVQP